jgi:hypothetical protein
MILIIRGHIRKSFTNTDLLNFIKEIYNIEPDLKIYIHTWSIFSNNISWRTLEIDDTCVTKEIFYDYALIDSYKTSVFMNGLFRKIKFIRNLKKIVANRTVLLTISGPVKIKKQVLKQFVKKLKSTGLIIFIKSKKSFNGCRPRKARKKKRKGFRIRA